MNFNKVLIGLIVGALFGVSLPAIEISGRVADQTGRGVPDVLVTDGVSWCATDGDGVYNLSVRDGQTYVILHQPTGFRADDWFLPVSGEKGFDFTLFPTAAEGKVRFIQIADDETPRLPYLDELRDLANEHHCDFILHTGDLCRFPAITVHARELNRETMGRDVFYTVGNHDIVAPLEDGSTFETVIGPYWYSFERKGVMFIAAPIHYGDVPLPYDLRDHGDWMKRLLELKPNLKYVIIAHTIPGEVMPPKVPSHDGYLTLDNRLLGVIFGHWHTNIDLGCSELAARAYCIAPPWRGGIDFDPAEYRLVEVDSQGGFDTRVILAGWHEGTPYVIRGREATDGELTFVCDPRGTLRAFDRSGEAVWEVPPDGSGLPPDRTGCAYRDGVVYAGFGRNLKAVDAKTGDVLWRNTDWAGGQSFMGGITPAGDVVVSGSQWRGIFANDAKTGKLVWKLSDEDARFTYATVTLSEDGTLWSKGLKKVYNIRPEDGKVLRVYDVGKEIQTAAPVAVLPGMILVGSANDGLFAVDRETGAKIWQFNDQGMGMVTTTPYREKYRGMDAPLHVSGKYVYACFLDGYIYKIRLSDGKSVGKYKIGRPTIYAPEVVEDGGALLYTSADGEAVCKVPLE